MKLTRLPTIDFQLASKPDFDTVVKEFGCISLEYLDLNAKQAWSICYVGGKVFGVNYRLP